MKLLKAPFTYVMAVLLLIFTVLLFLGKPASAAGECGGWLQPKCSADRDVAQDLENLVAQGNRTVGMPAIVNFFEKQMVRQLYEMRDDPTYRTYAYWTTIDGRYIKICDSIGYGINASIQYSNPVKLTDTSRMTGAAGPDVVLQPQAEPNALFTPEGLAATYVMCLDPATADSDAPKLVPVYVEQEVIVSPFPMGDDQ